MTSEQIKTLAKMKKLINQGCKKFAEREDRNYLQDLLDIGISEIDAWNEVLALSSYYYYPDYRPFYYKGNGSALTFKKMINGYLVYIKLKIEKYNEKEETVCLSFHIDFN